MYMDDIWVVQISPLIQIETPILEDLGITHVEKKNIFIADTKGLMDDHSSPLRPLRHRACKTTRKHPETTLMLLLSRPQGLIYELISSNFMKHTLWLCQISYRKWLEIGSFPITSMHGDFPISYVAVYQRVLGIWKWANFVG